VLQRPFDPASATLRDIFGWNRPFLLGRLDYTLRQLLVEAAAIQEHDGLATCTLRFSTCGSHLVVHSGFPTMGHDAVFFGPDTYRFIGLLDQTIDMCGSPARIVDIGTGTGMAAIHLSHRFPDAAVFGADINHAALQLCAVNAALNGVPVQPCFSDVLNGLAGSFDLIVANPPYLVDAAQRQYRHGGGKSGEGLSIRIVEEGVARLTPTGRLILYTGVAIKNGANHFRQAIEELLRPTPWRIHAYRETDPDVFGEELDSATYGDCDRIAVVGVVIGAQ